MWALLGSREDGMGGPSFFQNLEGKRKIGMADIVPPCRFLLKYASRDEVEVLGTGKGGIAELRKAVAEYDETNPLYGFLKYRRRNVLIKYLPEGCSRLIQGVYSSMGDSISDKKVEG